MVIDTNVFISALYLPESRPAKVVLLARRKTILNLIYLALTQNMQLQGVVLKIGPQGRCQEVHRVQLPLKS